MNKGKTAVKIIAAVIGAAVFSLGGYYIGRNSVQDLTSAIPKLEFSPAPTGAHAPPADKEPDSVTYVTRSDMSAAAEGTWSVVSSYKGDVDGDGQEDKLTIYTSAEKIDNEIVWDDGQNWILEVADADGGYYTLINQYVNNGSVYAEVSENANHEQTISVIAAGGMGFSVRRYNHSSSGFVEKIACEDKSANVVYSSIPYYN